MTTTFSYEIDWTNAGVWVDESTYLISCHLTKGMPMQAPITDVMANAGAIKLVLNNATQRFSADYSSGALYGNILPRRPIRVRATNGVTTWTVFRGWISEIVPDAGTYSDRHVTIDGVDTLGLMVDQTVAIDLQTNRRASELIAAAVNEVFIAPAATDYFTLTSNGLNGQSVTFGDNLVTYTFKVTIASVNDVHIGASKEATAQNLVNAASGGPGAGTDYFSGTTVASGVLLSITAGTARVDMASNLRGAIGNALTLAKVGAGITLNSSTFSGGADYPTGLTNYEQSADIYATSADKWVRNTTTAIQAISECAVSDQGVFFIARDGTVTYYDRSHFFKPRTSILSINSDPVELLINQNDKRVFNDIRVSVRPRSTLATLGVVAAAVGAVKVPGIDASGNASIRRVSLRFRDASGLPCAATGLVLPLVANDGYVVNEWANGLGWDWTTYVASNLNVTFLPPVITGTDVTLVISSTAPIPLYFVTLQVEGYAITDYDESTLTVTDSASQTAYQKKTMSLTLPLASDQGFAERWAEYLLSRYKDSITMIDRVIVDNVDTLGGVNVFSVELYNVITITDAQSAISGVQVFVVGFELDIEPAGFVLKWYTNRAESTLYWNLETANYGELGQTTRLAP